MKVKIKNICIIGAGNLGSRHLQALSKVKIPLNIFVIDPSSLSLKIAKERYNQMNIQKVKHNVIYSKEISILPKSIDLSIIATNSDVRRRVVEYLLLVSRVKYMILEKLLFQGPDDYLKVGKLLKANKCKAWVNCPRRIMPFYRDLKKLYQKEIINYSVTGSKYGLVTSSIHFIDFIAFLTGCYHYTVDIKHLDRKPIKSKRKGFLELNGTLSVYFKDGSIGKFTCFNNGEMPPVIEIYSSNYNIISKESENRVFFRSTDTKWQWKEKDLPMPFQSELTNLVAEEILLKKTCNLTPYELSSKLHLTLLNSLLEHLKNNYKSKMDYYPFT